MAFDLDKMSLKDLKDLQVQVAKAVSSFVERKRKAALADLEEKAREHGFSLSDLTGAAPARKRTPATAKYANPANPADTWSGRGRKPRWFEEAVASGNRPDDLLI